MKGMNTMKNWLKVLSFLLVFTTVATSVQAAEDPYEELNGLTLKDEMIAMIEKGIIQGYSDGTYRPKDDVTRQQFAAFVQRVLELEPAEPTFPDVNKSTALANSIGAVQLTGIMLGDNTGNFNPNKPITREEMAITMARVYEFKAITVNYDFIHLADADQFSNETGQLSAQMNAAAGVILGYPTEDGSILFKPTDITKRDQVSAVWNRYYKLLEEGPPPPPEPSPYAVATISNGQLVKKGITYKTYDAALNAYNNTTGAEAILYFDDIIKIKRGLAYAANTVVNTTSIYKDPQFKTRLTYVEEGREMHYVGSGPDYVIVRIGGTQGYVSHQTADLTPQDLITGRDYYYVSKYGTLSHYLYNHITKQTGSYSIAPKAPFMSNETTYYSNDGVNYTTATGAVAGEYYPYFQWQSVRTKSNYTAQELDNLIMTRLQELEAPTGRYKDATTKSKMIGLGAVAKQLETQYNVNALFVVSAAFHESAYGMSDKAQTLNNLYGIGIYDDPTKIDPEKSSFLEPKFSMEAFVKYYAGGGYVKQTDWRSAGAVPGNKTTGMNVNYASDPYWGAKIAGHMWRSDMAMGDKDYAKHQLGMTTATSTLNVRTQPVVNSSTLIFTYKQKYMGFTGKFGFPVVIIGEGKDTSGATWYQVQSDIYPPETGWIHSDYVRKLPNNY